MVNYNGKIFDNEDGLSFRNRGLNYGDAVFETIRVINGRIVFWEDHYFRLMASLRIMRMEIPSSFSPEYLEAEILNLVELNQLRDSAARIKFLVFRKEGGYYRPENRDIGYFVSCSPLEEMFYTSSQGPYEIELFKDHYVNSGLLSTVKTNNRAINVLGSIFAQENGYRNCLLLNEKKSVIEALNGNIFVIKDDEVKTPPLSDGCLRGVTRAKVIEILQKIPELKFREESVSAFELQKADEIFITNVILGIQPVSRYRKKDFGRGIAGNLLGRLNALARLS